MAKGASRTHLEKSGFTIVELLVVIVVIAILAAIAVVAYNGITGQAVESAMKSDLRANATGLELDKTTDGSYPSDGSGANRGQGLKSSGDNTVTYTQKPYGYCTAVTNARSDKTYVVKSTTNNIVEGTCDVIVTTASGNNGAGFADGPSNTAQFSLPSDIAVDNNGAVYVADSGNNRVRKITPDGVVSTLAGTGVSGFADGPGETAQFGWISAIEVDSNGYVYVTDGSKIRKISPSGVVSTWVNSSFGSVDSIAHSSDGTVFGYNSTNRIHKITPTGAISVLAGTGVYGYVDGSGATAQFGFYASAIPAGGSIATDINGNVYVADSGNNRIRKVTPDGVVSTLAGTGVSGFADGPGETAQFKGLKRIDVDNSGTIYVTESVGGSYARIRKITPNGVVSTLAGTGSLGNADGTSDVAQFRLPTGIAVDTSGTTIYIADYGSGRIRKITQ